MASFNHTKNEKFNIQHFIDTFNSIDNRLNSISIGNSTGNSTGNSDVMSVKTFGAIGDGITDDSDAIQEALDYSNTYQSYVYFPNGTYIVTKTLYFGYNVLLKGAVTGFQTNGHQDSNSNCAILFMPSDSSIPLFTGKSGITGGQVIIENLFFSTTTSYYGSGKKNTLIDSYNIISHSHFHALQIKNFDYVFKNLWFWMASRMEYCSIRDIGKAFFYNCSFVDCSIYNNYFNGSGDGTNLSSFMLNCPRVLNVTITNNWFEFFKYIVDTVNMISTNFSFNHIDYTYRILNLMGIASAMIGNTANCCDRASMIGKSWADAECLANNDWVSVMVQGYTGVTITGNVFNQVDRFIEIVGSNGAINNMHTCGNVIGTGISTTPFNNDDRLIRVNTPNKSWLGNAHLGNMKLDEINDLNYTIAPTTNLVPNRTAFIKGKHVYLDSNYSWIYMNDGVPYGYKSKNLIPLFSNVSWGFDGVNWIASADGTKVIASGYTATNWKSYSVLVSASSTEKYRFNTLTPYFASNGTSRNYLELHFLDGAGVEIPNTTIPIDSRVGVIYFSPPENTVNIKVYLNINYAIGLSFTFDTLCLLKYSENDYADIKTKSDGTMALTYLDNTNTTITQPFV